MIHEHGIKLSDAERKRLESSSMSQDRQIAMIFMNRPRSKFTFHDVVFATGFNQDSVKRSLSNMSGSDPNIAKYKDDYDRFPLVKTEEKKLNPDTGINIHLFRWNDRYNMPPTGQELLRKHAGNQMDFHKLKDE